MNPKDEQEKGREKSKNKNLKPILNDDHLGSSNAFEETENPLSRDADNISDEKLDEMLDD
jgi:hypothetical protein